MQVELDLPEKLLGLVTFWYGLNSLKQLFKNNGNIKIDNHLLREKWEKLWFAKNSQQKLIDKQLEMYEGLLERCIEYKPQNVIEKLGMIILFDQIPRNIYRKTERAYKYDDISRKYALDLLESNNEQNKENPVQLITIILSLIHSENLQHQILAKENINFLYTTTIDVYILDSLRGISNNHFERINLFSRIPERNKYIGRKSTEEELIYMKNLY